MVILTCSKVLPIEINLLNGIIYTLVTQDKKEKLMVIYYLVILKLT